ncbi:hypothetical protein FHG66_12795 [Rubellimicrobium rubrum]|uniref:Uncharacterized protein n=2 Tax=Rubellimicrobium rubrum TaxID=2585369 RepID=A0A5C4MSQ7_9RHOB|nr:hypothetical protein FHG66_12795 [Rubellimicrobium rubrum]
MFPDPTKTANLNLKVSEDARWAFKELCVRHRMSQVDGFRLAVRLLEEHLKGADAQHGSARTEGTADRA